MPDRLTARSQRSIICLANGNLNGRVMRLLADSLHRRRPGAVQVMTGTWLNALNVWPEERDAPHVLTPIAVDWAEAERRVQEADVFVLPPSWNESARRLVAIAHRAGTPVVYVMADIGYGARKLDTVEPSDMPDLVCVADPVTRGLLVRHGVAPGIIRNVGSPYLDAVLADVNPPAASGSPLRIGLLANPDGLREQLTSKGATEPEGVLPALERVLRKLPGAHLTVRLHPRQVASRVAEAFRLPTNAAFDATAPPSTLASFVAAHHLIVGSYSMGLMVARLLGRPAISFQPVLDDDGIRREVFAAWDVPIADDNEALAVLIHDRLRQPQPQLDAASIFYNPGRSTDAIVGALDEARAAARRRTGVPTSHAS